jgi:hypothetical protein
MSSCGSMADGRANDEDAAADVISLKSLFL